MAGHEFKVDLGDLEHAISRIKGYAHTIRTASQGIQDSFNVVNNDWVSPTAGTVMPIETWFTSLSGQLLDLLDEMVDRMHITHDNYVHVESTNHKDFVTRQARHTAGPGGHHSGPGGHHSGHHSGHQGGGGHGGPGAVLPDAPKAGAGGLVAQKDAVAPQ